MELEKTLFLQSGRSVKVISKFTPLEAEIDVLIKEPKETHYHPPIGISHPKYWKLKRMDPEKSRLLQIQYSGISKKQLRKVVSELGITVS